MKEGTPRSLKGRPERIIIPTSKQIQFKFIGPALSLGFSFSLLAIPATAEATRPTVRTAIAIRNLKLSLPTDFEPVVEKKTTGLAQESEVEQKRALDQAKDYIDFRSHTSSTARNRWLKACESSTAQNENFFCAYEMARGQKSANGARASTSSGRREIASDIRTGRYSEVAGRAYSDVLASISQLGDFAALTPIAERVLDATNVPSSIPTALAFKMEETFPDAKAVELAKRLYRKGSENGNDFSAAKASYRLGLIQVWQNDCAGVQELMMKTESVREASQFHSRARYWRYHCASVTGNEAETKAAKEGLAREFPLSFHNLAANGDDDATMAQILQRNKPTVAFRSLIRPDLNPVLRAGESLLELGASHLVAEIFDKYISDFHTMEPETRLYTAVLLSRASHGLGKFKILSDLFQDTPRMVSTATMRLYFPLWYFDLVKPKVEKIDPLLILSLIRQESAFNKQARSLVGARGLMQVMPATARSIASVRTNALFDPKTNIQVGTKYFMKRLDQFGGDVELTLAAYNAGAGRVDQWLKRYPTGNKILFIDLIPFKETREYVATILRNYYWYVKLYGSDAVPVQLEGAQVPVPKVQSIISANAGVAASRIRN
jgi:soluble lytic murein transglycosylase